MRFATPSIAVKYLLIINIAIYVINYFMASYGYDLNELFGLYFYKSPYFYYFQYFTYMFMHGSMAHIAFNMISLYSIGFLLERVWGSKRFLNFYLLCGLGGGIFYTLIILLKIFLINNGVDIQFVRFSINGVIIGASAAIFGIFTAVAMLFPNTEFYMMFIPVPIKAKYLLYFSVIISVVFGFLNLPNDSIGHMGHLGGIVTGYFLVKYYQQDKTKFY